MLIETDKKITAKIMDKIPVDEILKYRSNLLNNKDARVLGPSGNNIQLKKKLGPAASGATTTANESCKKLMGV